MRGLAVVSFTSFLLTLAACSDQSDTSPTDAVSDPDLRRRLQAFKERLAAKVLEKNRALKSGSAARKS